MFDSLQSSTANAAVDPHFQEVGDTVELGRCSRSKMPGMLSMLDEVVHLFNDPVPSPEAHEALAKCRAQVMIEAQENAGHIHWLILGLCERGAEQDVELIKGPLAGTLARCPICESSIVEVHADHDNE